MALVITASSIRHRKEFQSAVKDTDETLENWYDRVKSLAEPCEYGQHSDAFILNQFICGLDGLILDFLYAEHKDLSLDNVFDLTKQYERNSETLDVKPLLVSIKVEDLELSSDGEHYVDNTFSDGDDEDHEATNEQPNNVTPVTPNDGEQEDSSVINDDAKKSANVHPRLPYMSETQMGSQDIPRLFECYLCHKTWKTAGNLTYHFTCYHTIGKVNKCHLCGKWIQDPSNMVRHLNMHFRTKQFCCNICDASFARSYSLRKHLLVHNEGKGEEFKCNMCSKVFVTKIAMQIHKKNHKEEETSLSEKFDILMKKQKIQRAKARTAAKGKFQCDICSAPFEKESALNEHLKVHSETEWLCHLCGKKLMNKRNLIHHYRVHTNEKPFLCGDCGRAFSSKEKLKLHSKGHDGVRPHQCTRCEKSFIQKGHLEKHMKVHFPDIKFKCDQCPMEFTREDKYTRHLLVHSGLKPAACAYCDKTFKTNHHRNEHQRIHTGEKPYQCPSCDKRFAQRSTLRGHIKTHLKPKVPRPKKKRTKKPKIGDIPIEYPLVPATAGYLI